jgi:hypothetical protein
MLTPLHFRCISQPCVVSTVADYNVRGVLTLLTTCSVHICVQLHSCLVSNGGSGRSCHFVQRRNIGASMVKGYRTSVHSVRIVSSSQDQRKQM